MRTLKDVERQIEDEPHALSGALSLIFRGYDRNTICELITAYYEGVVDDHFASVVRDAFGSPYRDWANPTDAEAIEIQADLSELRSCQRRFRQAVDWLCGLKEDKRGPEGEFRARSKAGKLEWGRYPEIDRRSERFVAYFENHGLKHFKLRASLQHGELVLFPRIRHLVDPFCAFLLNECAERKREEMPVKLCSTCGKLFSVFNLRSKARARKEHCSLKCQQAGWWTSEKRADDIFVKRLCRLAQDAQDGRYGHTLSDFRKRFDRAEVRRRLERIKRRWAKDARTILERVKTIEDIGQQPEEQTCKGVENGATGE